ncbi:MAG: polysaccharide biosynthesis tyrosine autokinase [Flavobacteriia bacterium]
MNSAQKGLIINKGYNPHLLRSVLRKFWFLPIIFISIFLSIAFLYLRYTKMVFKSSSVIQIEKKDQGKEILDIEEIAQNENNISSEIELLKSEFLFENAIENMNLNVSLFSKGNILTEELYHMSSFNVIPFELKDSALCNTPIFIKSDGKKVTFSYTFMNRKESFTGKLDERISNKHFDVIFKIMDYKAFNELNTQNELYFTFNEKKSLIKRLLSGLEVAPADPEAQTVLINYKGNNPLLCHDIIVSLTNAFFNYDDEIQKKSSENILTFINLQLDSIAGELKYSKDSLTRYLKSSNLPDPDEMGKSINENINTISDKLYELDNEISTLRLVNSKLKADPNRLEIYKLIPEMLGKSYENSLSKQIQDLYNLLEKKEDLLFELTEENSVIKDINAKINSKIYSIKKSVTTILERLIENQRLMQSKLSGFESEFFSLPDKKMEYNRLKSLQDLNEKYYGLLAEKKVLYSISKAGFSSNNRVLTQPEISASPISPNRKMVYGGFLFVGLLLGLTYLAFKYFTFNEINNADELKMLLPEQASILGSVPITKRSMDFSQIIVHDSPKSMLSEALRNIRANMSFIKKDAQTIAISSSISGEGKTFVALNLAAIIAMSGKRTIVIDLDLRKPKIHLGFNTNNDNGMSNLIVNQISLMECIQKSEIVNLDFITAGPIPPNPSELILSKDFQNILEKIKSMYDVIIIDNPPVGLVSDGVQILASADIPIYVFKAHYSKRVFAERVRELFEVQQIKSLNVILNGVVPGRSGYGYDYGYNYGYGYGYGGGYYYEESDKKKTLWSKILKFLRIRK